MQQPFKGLLFISGGITLWVFLAILAVMSLGATTTTSPTHFHETPITTNGAQDSHYLSGPSAHCTIFGTWDGASVTVQTQIEDGGGWVNTGWSDFVGATLDVPFTKVEMGSGVYRAVVSTAGASTSLTFYCRWS